MNERMSHVFAALMAMIVAIIGFTTYWQIVDAGSLRKKDFNSQTAYYEQRIKRGLIYSANGTILARNKTETDANGNTIYARAYKFHGLFAHIIGYSTSGKSRTGIERVFNDSLTGSVRSLASVVDKIKGREDVRGDAIYTTLNVNASKIAQKALQGRKGAVVALNPKTGEILVAESSPTFDPNEVEHNFAKVNARESALLNRVTQARYAPGSTFKLVVAAAAMEAGITEPADRFKGGCSYKDESGPPIQNFGGSCVGGHDLTTALTKSINVTFAELGDRLGSTRLRTYMARFGFGEASPLEDLPPGESRSSGLFAESGALLTDSDPIDAARVAIGQERLGVTPLQMALVAGTIANDGMMMRPFIVSHTQHPGGKKVSVSQPKLLRTVMSRKTADDLTQMMKNVVREGSGTAAALQGVSVAGKTGTADTPSGNQVWFVCFAPADNPQVAMVVTVEGLPSGATGGVYAAPIARDVLEELLR